MKNSYKLGLAAIAASMALVGCGGGSTDTSALTDTSVLTGKSYYIDSAVSGVSYTCGTQEGITGVDGSFTFEVGSSCTFYLGDIKLRDVNAGLLVDGANVYETDVAIARILQSLDTDGNPDNGITINAAILEALATEGITSLPTDTTEMATMLSVIGQNGGTVVSEIEAQEHLMSSLFSNIDKSPGKSFYIVQDWNINQWIAFLEFDEFNVIYGAGGGDGGMLWIDGDKLHQSTTSYSMYYMVKEVTADYILLDSYVNDTLSATERFYFDEAKAQEYLASLTTPMTTAMLSGKVFYTDGGDNFEQISFISSSEVTFREILLNADGSINVDTGANAYPYTINASGDVVINFGGGNTNTYKLIDTTATQWNMVKNGDANSAFSTWLLNAPSKFPVVDTTEPSPDTTTVPTAAEIESFVSGKDFSLYGITVSFASDYSYSDNDNCTGTWAVSNNTLTVTGSCSYNLTFNEALVDGMTVTLNITDQTPAQTMDVTLTETTVTTTPILEITEALLSGKTFYEQDYETDQNNVKIADIYGEMTLANGVLTRTEVYVDVNTGAETVDGPFTLDYTIINGQIRVDLTVFNEGYGWFTLNATNTDAWDLTMEDDRNPQDGIIDVGSDRATTWYLSKPVGYPEFTTGGTTTPTALESSVSGKVLLFTSPIMVPTDMTATFGGDYTYSDDAGCIGNWAAISDNEIGVSCDTTVIPTSTNDSDKVFGIWQSLGTSMNATLYIYDGAGSMLSGADGTLSVL